VKGRDLNEPPSDSSDLDLGQRLTAKVVWVFLALWIVIQAVAGIGIALWTRSEPGVRYWVHGPQGDFVLAMFGLFLGVAIIAAMQRPKSVTELLDLFSVKPSLREVRFRWLWLGVAIGIVAVFGARVWGGGDPEIGRLILRARSEGGLAYIVAAMMLGPFPEEAILRGYVYQGFRRSYGRFLGIALVAALNVVLHLDSIRGSFFAAYFYCGLGVLQCFIFDTRRNLMDSIVFHAAYNTTIICHMIIA
jgi:membrane protease YdiL (CAAX protease family)